jgi:hypothetical protein
MSTQARDAIDPLFTLKFFTDPQTGRNEVERYVCIILYPSPFIKTNFTMLILIPQDRSLRPPLPRITQIRHRRRNIVFCPLLCIVRIFPPLSGTHASHVNNQYPPLR